MRTYSLARRECPWWQTTRANLTLRGKKCTTPAVPYDSTQRMLSTEKTKIIFPAGLIVTTHVCRDACCSPGLKMCWPLETDVYLFVGTLDRRHNFSTAFFLVNRRDCLISTLGRGWQAFAPNYEYLLINARTENCGGNPQRQCSTPSVSARSYYIIVSASYITILSRPCTRRGVLDIQYQKRYLRIEVLY